MRIEIILLIVVAGVCYHIYTDGAWMRQLTTHKKYLQIGGTIICAIFLYWLFKKNPSQAHQLILSGNEYVKYLPLDPATSSIITPIIDFTSKWTTPFSESGTSNNARERAGVTRMMTSGGGGSGMGSGGEQNVKRSVSESKKKFVASGQDWCCYNCKEKLKATFEVDHIVPLFKGGTNQIDTLRALCLECHRLHTISDKLLTDHMDD
jgi:hypothetical protein